jgi:hypothetical protein
MLGALFPNNRRTGWQWRSGNNRRLRRDRTRAFDVLEGRRLLSVDPQGAVLTKLSAHTQAEVRPELPWVDEPITPNGVVRQFLGPTFSLSPDTSGLHSEPNASGTFQIVFEKGPNLQANFTASAVLE